MSEQRMMTFQLHVEDSNGTTTVKEFRRAITDLDSSVDLLNKGTADNVSVTAKMVTGEKEALAQARSLVTQNERRIKQVSSVKKQYTDLTNTYHLSANALEIYNAQVRAGVEPLSAQGKEIAELVKKHQQLRSAGDGTRSSMRNLRGTAQNLGWQLQDVAVQAQMGTNAMVILGQQGSQILSSFGAAGALAGAGLAILASGIPALMTALGDTEVSTKELEAAQKELNKVFNEGKSSTSDLTDEMIRLFQTDKALANLKLNTTMLTAKTVMDGALQSAKGLSEQFKEINDAEGKIDQNSITGGMLKQVQLLKKYSKELGISSEQMKTLSEEYAKAEKDGSMMSFSSVLTEIANSAGVSNPVLNKLAKGVADSAVAFSTAQEQYESASSILNNGLPDGLNETADKYREMTTTLNMNARELSRYNIIQEYSVKITELGADATSEAIKALRDQRLEAIQAADEYYNLVLITKSKADADKEAAKNAKEEEKSRTAAAAEAKKTYEANKKIVDRLIESQRKHTATLKEEYKKRQQTVNQYAVSDKQRAEGMASVEKWYTAEVKKETDKQDKIRQKAIDKNQKQLDKMQKELNKDTEDSDPVGSELNKHALNISKYKDLWADAANIAADGEQDGFDQLMSIYAMEEQEADRHAMAMIDAQTKMASNSVAIASMMVTSLSTTVDLISGGGAAIEEQMEGMNNSQKTMFLLMQSVAAAQALVNGISMGSQLAAAAAAYDVSGISSLAWIETGAAIGAAQAGAIMGVTFAGAFDKGGYIPDGQVGIVSEYADELVNGTLVKGPAKVTGSAETANIMKNQGGAGGNISQTIVVNGNGDKALIAAMKQAAKKGAEQGYKMVQNDISVHGPIRKTLKRSQGI